jgi:DNA-binding NarL/FixJ family response regulator
LVEVWIGDLEGLQVAVLRYRSPDDSVFEQLTPAERAVARLAASGLPARRIAAARGASERTVTNQLSSAYRKCGVASRAELTALLLATPVDAEPLAPPSEPKRSC